MSKMIRMIPTERVLSGEPIKVYDRIYKATYGVIQDVPEGDAAILDANGWLRVCIVGTTAQRPFSTGQAANQIYRGQHYYDTTLGKMIVFDEKVTRDALGNFVSVEQNIGVWRDPATGAVV